MNRYDDWLLIASREIDGEATAAERAQLAEARRRDPRLARECDALSATSAALRAVLPVNLPQGLEGRVLASIREQARPVSRWRLAPLARVAGAAAVLALAVAIGHRAISPLVSTPETVEAAPSDAVRAEEAARAAWRALGVSEDRIAPLLALRAAAEREATALHAQLSGQKLTEALRALDARTATQTLGLLNEAERARYAEQNGLKAQPDGLPGNDR